MTIAKTFENYSHSWGTPPEWMDWVHRTLDCRPDILFDPCSALWTPAMPSGLDIPWEDPSYCNHPGSRGSAQRWWAKYLSEQKRQGGRVRFVWCAFNVESLRHLRPSPFHLAGWFVWPRDRISFIWGGETIPAKFDKKRKRWTKERKRGQPAQSPGNSAVFWTNVPPANPPIECVIVRTC